METVHESEFKLPEKLLTVELVTLTVPESVAISPVIVEIFELVVARFQERVVKFTKLLATLPEREVMFEFAEAREPESI